MCEHFCDGVGIVDDFLTGFHDGLFRSVEYPFGNETQLAFLFVVVSWFGHPAGSQLFERVDQTDKQGGVAKIETGMKGCQNVSQIFVGRHEFLRRVEMDKVT